MKPPVDGMLMRKRAGAARSLTGEGTAQNPKPVMMIEIKCSRKHWRFFAGERPRFSLAFVDRSEARIVPTILLHFLHPWRSDVRERPSLEVRCAGAATYRVAVGPHQGQKAFTLQTLPAHTEERDDVRLAKAASFSLHYGVASAAHQRAYTPTARKC